MRDMPVNPDLSAARSGLRLRAVTRPRTAAWRAARRDRPAAASVSWVPSSTRRPWSITRMRSHASTVASRCAITIVVRPAIKPLERLSPRSRSRHRATRLPRRATAAVPRAGSRAIAMRWRWPPDKRARRARRSMVSNPSRQARDELGRARRARQPRRSRRSLASGRPKRMLSVMLLREDRDVLRHQRRCASAARADRPGRCARRRR